jgi:hypothetical protein
MEEPLPSTSTGNDPVGPALTKRQKRRLAKKEVSTGLHLLVFYNKCP